MKKVYCKNCKHYQRLDILLTPMKQDIIHKCFGTAIKIGNFLEPDLYKSVENAEKRNEKNDCKYYKPDLITSFQETFNLK